MTKKDYIKIAEVLKDHWIESDTEEEIARLSDLISELAVLFQSDNSKFDQDKFLEACGL